MAERSQIFTAEQADNHRLYPEGSLRYFVSSDPADWRDQTKISREEVRSALSAGRIVEWRDTSCAFCGGPTPCTRND